jgi:hypothetical protein
LQGWLKGLYFLIEVIPTEEELMSKKKYRVRAECPACACGDITFLGPEKLREKFIGDESEIEVTCPMCGTKHKGQVQVDEEKTYSQGEFHLGLEKKEEK